MLVTRKIQSKGGSKQAEKAFGSKRCGTAGFTAEGEILLGGERAGGSGVEKTVSAIGHYSFW